MKWTRKLLPVCVALGLGATAATAVEEDAVKTQSIFADMENPEKVLMARQQLDISMYCAPIKSQERKLELYQSLKQAKWDRHGMGCGLQYGTEIIDDSSFSLFNIEEKLLLLGARIEYFDVLNKQYNAHYQGGDLTVELGWRWDRNKHEGQALIDSVQ
ncbi:MAG: hypothetical protein VXZ35_05355, partial [Pseudomonadota bacterium]|nr:hypothetical protein [Pseudomonadota bacterium]